MIGRLKKNPRRKDRLRVLERSLLSIAIVSEPLFIRQGSLPRLLRAAESAWKRQDFQRSFEILERASRLVPNDPCVLLDLGSAHGLCYDYAEAQRWFEKAIRLSGWKTASFVAAGIHCLRFNQYEMARRYFERALKKNGDSTEVLVHLAGIYERQHQLDAAAGMVDRALRLNGNCTSALLAHAKLHRLAGRLEEAERILRSFVTKPDPDTRTHLHAWYELGRVLDGQARYDDAMAAFLEAKALAQPTAAALVAVQQAARARTKKMAETISADVLQRWFEAGNTPRPPARLTVLGGHPRSGTTLLEQVLDAHPEIVSAEETTIFHDYAVIPLVRGFSLESVSLTQILDSASPAQLQQFRENYLSLTERFLGETVGGRLLVDKNPALTVFMPAIVRVFPEAKFLVALRDPRDVCLSCFTQPLALTPMSSAYLSLEGTVAEYASVMGFWRTLKPQMRNPCLEVRYEDLVDDLESVARRALEFLGVTWDACVLDFNEHARSRVVRSPTYAEVAKPVFKSAVGRWRNYQKHLEPWMGELEPFVKAFGYE
jgi:tetratricopeptide (TPR) repeat protein